MKSLRDRFYEKFIVHPRTRCWIWTASDLRGRYGRIGVGQDVELAHRVSWRLHLGEIPDGINVLHRCDNAHCVNPDHLFLGTQQVNMDDKVLKNRQQKGESVPTSKLTVKDVSQIKDFFKTIKSSKYTQGYIASEFGITQRHVRKILSGNAWKHIA